MSRRVLAVMDDSVQAAGAAVVRQARRIGAAKRPPSVFDLERMDLLIATYNAHKLAREGVAEVISALRDLLGVASDDDPPPMLVFEAIDRARDALAKAMGETP